MRHLLMGFAAVVLLGSLVPRADALEIFKNEKASVNMYGRGQMIGVGQFVPDPYRDNYRIYLFLKQARIGFKGNYEEIKFDAQMAFGGENANGTNTDLGLLDFVADVPLKLLGEDGSLKVGQFRVPYSREGLTDRGYMSFGERSIANMASYQGRDYGVALQKYRGAFAATLGVFSAGGRDIPQRYLPERLGAPETVLRVGYNDGLDEDIYHVVGMDIDLKRTTKAAYLNAMYVQDTLIGHGNVLNLKTIDKNLLINSNYNQFINAGPNKAAVTNDTRVRGNLWFVGGDAAIRHPLGEEKSVEGEAEVNWGGYKNRYGALHIASYRVQGAYSFRPYQVGMRYAGLLMDNNANYLSGGKYFSPSVGSVIHELTPSLAWHIKRHNLKLIGDIPTYFNMPVFTERSVGSYVFASQPDQVSVLATAGNTVKRRTIVEMRLLMQFMF